MLLQIFSPVKSHFLICFLALVIYRYLERNLENAFSCETILDKLRTMNFADIQEQGFIPLYTQDKLTDALHTVCGFETDYKFITKRQMKNIQKKVRAGNKILYSKTTHQITEPQ